MEGGEIIQVGRRPRSPGVFFFTLADTGGSEKLPLITIPAQ